MFTRFPFVPSPPKIEILKVVYAARGIVAPPNWYGTPHCGEYVILSDFAPVLTGEVFD